MAASSLYPRVPREHFSGLASEKLSVDTGEYTYIYFGYTEMILGFASRNACLEDLDKWAASRLQVACQ